MDERPIEEKYLWGRISRDLYQVGEQTYTSSWKLEDMAKKEWAKEINIADKLDNFSAQLDIISRMIKGLNDLPADKDPNNWFHYKISAGQSAQHFFCRRREQLFGLFELQQFQHLLVKKIKKIIFLC
jgi:hypothetical protein